MKAVKVYQRRAKIVGTIGPASGKAATMNALLRAGMNVARFNLSHGNYRDHEKYIRTIRNASTRTGIPASILIDLPGPKYRIGRLKDGQVMLRRRQQVRLTGENREGDGSVLPVTLPNLARDIRVGDTVILDDGAMQLRVRSIEDGDVICWVVIGGLLRQGRGLVVPGMKISIPFVTDRLREGILFAVGQKPDYLALSFVTGEQDIVGVRAILAEHGARIPIIAKIERAEAVANFSSILAAADGIMIARGDLGVEMPLERVPLIQKDIIRKCNRAGKPVI
ncbi:MAG: pyruvate kinase, partial [Dehalococcoidales bacterium]|nr:pyruvate kinase [Dehalococcoidales bacterium]